MKVKHSCYRCGERENTRFSPDSTFPYAVLGSLKVIDDYVVILLRIRLIQDASISKTSQGVPSTIAKGKTMNKARTRISPYGWVMIMLLLILGAINFADKAVLGLAIVTFGSAIGPAVFAPTLTFVIVVVGWRVAFALLGGIGLLWVILWLLVGRERPETRPMPVQETQGERPKMHWSEARPLFFSRTVIFSILAAFGAYWATALYLTWNPVYLVTVRHLRLSDPLYLAGITLPYIVGAITFIVFGAYADRIFRRTGSYRRSYVYLVTVLLMVSALCLFLAVSVPSALGAVFFFTIALFGVTFPMVSTIITALAPEAHRGAVLGIVVAIFTLPGIIAPLVTGLIIQAAGKNVAVGFHNAYLLASLFLLVFGVVFLAFARPDEQHLGEKGSIHVVLSHE